MNSFRSTSKSRITDFGLIDNPSKQCRHILSVTTTEQAKQVNGSSTRIA